MQRLTLRIDGHVQGVFFRDFVVSHARTLDLVGFVRNETDGSVSAVFEGVSAALDDMLALCRSGPPAALVSSVRAERSAATGEFADFTQRL